MSETTRSLEGNQYRVSHTVSPSQSGTRLDRFLMERYPHRSREQLKKAIDSGAITVVRRSQHKHLTLGKLKPSFALQHGDTVEVLSIRRAEPDVNFNYHTLLEDDSILAIHKPAHLPVHPAGRYFFNTLLTHLKTSGFTQEAHPDRDFFLPHRIDKETSGILLLAKTKEACAHLVKQFSERLTEKAYLAIVRGRPKENRFSVTSPIGKKPGSKIGLKMYALKEAEGGLPSHTDFQVIEVRQGEKEVYSLVACFPKTGRQHQIRVHAEIAGYPLLGDKIYGWPEDWVYEWLENHRQHIPAQTEAGNEPVTEDTQIELEEEFEPTPEEQGLLVISRHALHAAGLKFTHPRTEKTITLTTDLPEDLAEFFNKLPLIERISTFQF